MTKVVNCGDVLIGGGNPISIQSMTNVNSKDKRALIEQISQLKDAGCQIVRIAVPDVESAQVFGQVKEHFKNQVPLVADIHFDYRLAIMAIENGADKVRINPGNIGSIDRIIKVVNSAKERNIPIRVGVNAGSLEKDILQKYGKVCKEAICESAVKNLKIIEDLGYDNLVISVKSSDVLMSYQAHKMLVEKTNHPIHIGITEAGTKEMGTIKSAIGIGALLLEGIGDTMRVSLTANPLEEVRVAKDILKALGMRKTGIDIVSCPTCGRTKVDLQGWANEATKRLQGIENKLILKENRPIKVAIMGCEVNGPGEARDADFGIAGGKGKGVIFAKGQIVKTVDEENAIDELIQLIEEEFKCVT